MQRASIKTDLVRPHRHGEAAVPALPAVDKSDADQASITYSAYRSGLSSLRTNLSEHRTSLSEYRTDLSGQRTELSTERTDMAMRRTGMSFQRTRMSAERTLMSVIRTSLSLIGFGFTIYQVFSKLVQMPGVELRAQAPRNFGVALVAMGILMLTFGIIYHVRFMKELRAERNAMTEEGLIHGESRYPISMTLITAGLLWLLGLLAIVSMTFNLGTLG